MVGIKEITLGVYGILSTWFLCLFVWWAVLFGGESGKIVLYFNIYNEMWLEFFLLNGLFIMMVTFFISMLKKEFTKK
jgi:hypothetical protein